jgi:protein DGCR14
MALPPSKQRRKVLPEEEYTSTLTSIVQRDYFPALPELQRHAAILERRAQGDVAGAVAVRRAVRRLQQHEEALAAEEEEQEYDLDSSHNNAGPVRRRARPLHQESISGFHSRVTTEDDEEFDSNQKKEITENRERLEKLFRPNTETVPLLTNNNNNMASDQFQAEPNRIAATEWNNNTVRNGFFFNPTPLRNQTSQESTSAAAAESVKLIANGSKEKSISSSSSQLALMPPPARPEVPGKHQLTNIVPKHQLVEFIPKQILEKRIEPSRTRFPTNHQIIPLPRETGRGLVPTSDLDSETDGSITDASTDLDAPVRPVDEERRRELRRRERNQQSYVAMTPLIVPGTTGNESPIMTWGTVDSTPLVLSGRESAEETRQSSYSLAGENERERAARRAEKDLLTKRSKRAKTTTTTTRQPSQNRVAASSKRGRHSTPSLTPAALALWKKTTGQITPSRARDAFASSLRSSYTPKLQSKSSSSVSRGSGVSSRKRPADNAFNATPLPNRK